MKRLQKLLYFAIMRALDDEIASTYAALVSTGKANSTMFVFSSDNGALVDSPGDNGDLRDGKGSPYEGGHRVPTFIIWPGVVAPGAKIDGPIWIGDLFATFIAAAGGRVPGGTDSVNALPAITSGVPHIRNGTDSVVPHVSKEEVTNPTTGAKSIIGEFAINNNETQKYIRRLEFSEDATTIVGITEELYNLRNDPQETTNRVADPLFARVLTRMRNMYASFGGNAYFSGLKTYRRVPLPDGYVPPLIYMYPAYRTWDAAQAAGVVFHSDTAFQDPPASAAK